MKIYTTPSTTQSEKTPREYFDGGKIFYIPNGKDASSVYTNPDEIALLKKTRMSKMRKLWKFTPVVLDLMQYVGRKDALFKELDNAKMIFAEGGNTFDIARLFKASFFAEWLAGQKQNPDMRFMGHSGGVVALCDNLFGIENLDSPRADYFNLGARDATGIGVTGNTMVLQHKKSAFLRNGKQLADYIDETVALRKNMGLQTIAVQDSEMFEWDLISNRKSIIKSTAGQGLNVTPYKEDL